MHPAGPLVALVGNPNCGKTALFNLLTGSRQKVANYAGVTVERKEGRLLGTAAGRAPRVLDLPGAYSLYPRSPDERVTADVLAGRAIGEKRPDLVVCVVDSTNLRRNLRLVLAVLRQGLPVVVALNMADLAQRRGLEVDPQVLSAKNRKRIGVRTQQYGNQPFVRTAGDAHGEPVETLPGHLPISDPSASGLDVCAYPDLVPIPHPSWSERTRMAGPSNGSRRLAVPSAGQLLRLDRGLRTSSETAGPAVGNQLG